MASPRKPPPPVKPGRPDMATVAKPVISELSQDGTVSFAGTPDASYEHGWCSTTLSRRKNPLGASGSKRRPGQSVTC